MKPMRAHEPARRASTWLMCAMLVSGAAVGTRAEAGALLDMIDKLGPPPPEVTVAEVNAANADIPFYNARVELSNARVEALCASLARTRGNAQGLPAVSRYFARYAKDDAELLKRFPKHSNFILNMDYKTRMLQYVVTPEYFRRACSAGKP